MDIMQFFRKSVHLSFLWVTLLGLFSFSYPDLLMSKQVKIEDELISKKESRVIGIDDRLYHAKMTRGTIFFLNSKHNLCATFDRRGAKIRGNKGSMRFQVIALGYGETLKPLKSISPVAYQNRVEYKRDTLSEWYINGPMGVEQGFTLNQPPTKSSDGLLTIALDLTGNLQPILNPDQTFSFKDEKGATTHYYKGLVVNDASGRELPVQLKIKNKTLLLLINDKQAEYPLTID